MDGESFHPPRDVSVESSAPGDEVHPPALSSGAPPEVRELAEDGGSTTLGKRPRGDATSTSDESMEWSQSSDGSVLPQHFRYVFVVHNHFPAGLLQSDSSPQLIARMPSSVSPWS